MKILTRLSLPAILIALAIPAIAQQTRIPIAVTATAHDAIGQAYVYQLKEALSHSAVFRYSTDSDTPLTLHIVSVGDDAPVSAIAVTLTANFTGKAELYWDDWAIRATHETNAQFVSQLLAGLSGDIDELREALQRGSK